MLFSTIEENGTFSIKKKKKVKEIDTFESEYQKHDSTQVRLITDLGLRFAASQKIVLSKSHKFKKKSRSTQMTIKSPFWQKMIA